MAEPKKTNLPAHLPDRPAYPGIPVFFLSGFFLAGMLMGALGSLTVSWRYQLDNDPRTIGIHFFAFDASLLLAGYWMHILRHRVSLEALGIGSSLLACAGLVGLAIAAPPVDVIWRIIGVAVVGAAAGGLLSSLLRSIRPYYEERAGFTLNICGAMFGTGALVATLVGGTTYRMNSMGWEPSVLAFACLLCLPFLKRIPSGTMPDASRPPFVRRPVTDFKNVTAILFSGLLFFQFGNEWALAGWLPLLLVRRLGMNPALAILMLALFFFSVVAGRLASPELRRHVSHSKMLFGSVALAMFGYLLLSFTKSTLGAALATAVTGFAFGPIYALVAEKIGRRFDYEPGFFNGIFSFAVAGGMLIPALLGFVGYYLAMEYLLVIPAFGSAVVLVLTLLIVLTTKVLGGDGEELSQPGSPAAKPTTVVIEVSKE
jgi:fucose permease